MKKILIDENLKKYLPFLFFFPYFGTAFIFLALIFTAFSAFILKNKVIFISGIFFLTLGIFSSYRDFRTPPTFYKQSKTESQYVKKFKDFIKNKGQSEILTAIATGEKDYNSTTIQQFIKTGTIHLLTLSAFHIGIIILFFSFIFKFIRNFLPIRPFFKDLLFLALKIAAVVYYILLTGKSIPTIRAGVFILLIDLFLTLGITSEIFFTFLISLIFTGIIIPKSIESYSFLMSAISVSVILFIWKKLPKSEILKIISVSVLISFALMPITTKFSGYFSLLSPLVNLIIIPFFIFLAISTLFIQFLYPVSTNIALFFMKISLFFSKIIEKDVTYLAKISEKLFLPTIIPKPQIVIIFTTSFILSLFLKGKIKIVFILILFISSFFFFQDFSSQIIVKKMTKMPGKYYCINKGKGEGIVVEIKHYWFKKQPKEIFIKNLNINLAKCKITTLQSIHLKKNLSKELIQQLKRQKRFKKMKVYTIKERENLLTY